MACPTGAPELCCGGPCQNHGHYVVLCNGRPLDWGVSGVDGLKAYIKKIKDVARAGTVVLGRTTYIALFRETQEPNPDGINTVSSATCTWTRVPGNPYEIDCPTQEGQCARAGMGWQGLAASLAGAGFYCDKTVSDIADGGFAYSKVVNDCFKTPDPSIIGGGGGVPMLCIKPRTGRVTLGPDYYIDSNGVEVAVPWDFNYLNVSGGPTGIWHPECDAVGWRVYNDYTTMPC